MNPNVHLIHFSTSSPSATNSHFIFNNNAFAHFNLSGIFEPEKKKTSQNTENEDEASLWVVKVNMWVKTILT